MTIMIIITIHIIVYYDELMMHKYINRLCHLQATIYPITVRMANASRKQVTMTIKMLTKTESASEAVKYWLIASCWLRMMGRVGGGRPSSRNDSSKPRCSGSPSILVSDDRPIRPFGHVQSSISLDPVRLAKRTREFHTSMTHRCYTQAQDVQSDAIEERYINSLNG